MGLGRPIDGILSVYTFEGLLLTLDYPAGEMRVAQGRLPRPDGETVFSTRGPDGRPWLRVDLAGRERRLLIDSGAGRLTMAVNHIDRLDLMDEPRVLTSALRLDRIERRRIARLDGDAVIAGLSIENPVVEEVPRSELLGGEILRHFVITLDQAHKRVRFEPAVAGPVPAQDHVEIGAGLRPVADGLEVFEVYPGAPFAAAGVQAGDLITHFDGTPVAERGCTNATGSDRLMLTVSRERDRARHRRHARPGPASARPLEPVTHRQPGRWFQRP
jgi:Trypsin-like serine proteases, typically periplasmic, contain C-terminal PDZ domain